MTLAKPVITLVLMLSTAVLSTFAYPAMEADDVWRLIRTIRHPQELPAVVPQHHNLHHERYDYGQPQQRSQPDPKAEREASDYADYNDLMLLLDENRDADDDYDLKRALLSRQLARGLSAPFFAASSRNSVPAVWLPEETPVEYDSGAGLWYDPIVQDGAESEDADGTVKSSSLTDMLNSLSENRNENLEQKRSQRQQEMTPASVAVTTAATTTTTAATTATTYPASGQKEVAIMRPAAPSRQSQYYPKMAASGGSSNKRKMASKHGSSVISYQDDLTEELDNLKRTMN